jgi:Flp pilus assembly protein TadG
MRRTLDKVLKILDGQPTGKRGQSFVEMAFTTPFLIFMVMGAVEIGFAANNFLILQDAVREAGRQAVNLDPTTWGDNESRNQESMDCDNTINTWNLSVHPIGTGEEGKAAGDRDGRSQTTGPITYGLGIDNNPNIPHDPRGQALKSLATNPYFDPFYVTAAPPSAKDGTSPDAPSGFFDQVACQAVAAMSPLTLNDSDTNSKDDVVVSAISYTNLDYTSTGFNIGGITGTPNTGNQGPSYPLTAGNNHGDHWMTVTGRYPIENRYCRTSAVATGADMDNRDPFDYLRHDMDTVFTNGRAGTFSAGGFNLSPDDIPLNPSGTPAVTSGNERYERVVDTAAIPTSSSHMQDFYLLEINGSASNSNQNVRGYTLMGNNKSSPNNCYGSSFTVQDIEAKLNLDANNNPAAPNSGLVIVEIFWQYHPLVFGPLFEGFNSQDKTADPVFHVWGFFPVPGVESTATP